MDPLGQHQTSSLTHKEDELLVVRCQLGERSAFEELTERWHLPLWKYVRRVAGNDDAASDAIQDVWLRVSGGSSGCAMARSYGPGSSESRVTF